MGEMDPWAMPQVCQGSKVCGCLGLDNAQLTFLSSEARCSDGQVVSPQPSLFWDRTSDFGAAALWRGPLVPPLQNTHVSWMVGPEECQAKVPPHPKSGPLASEPLRAPQACWCLSHLTVMLRSPKSSYNRVPLPWLSLNTSHILSYFLRRLINDILFLKTES